jgi:hypothetical protein
MGNFFTAPKFSVGDEVRFRKMVDKRTRIVNGIISAFTHPGSTWVYDISDEKGVILAENVKEAEIDNA